MTTPRLVVDNSDFNAAAAEYIDPRAPRTPIDVPQDQRSFAFTLDSDLIKLVSLVPGDGQLAVRVRYATDAVMAEDLVVLRLSQDPQITADGLGLVIVWRVPLIPGLSWPTLKRTRRF